MTYDEAKAVRLDDTVEFTSGRTGVVRGIREHRDIGMGRFVFTVVPHGWEPVSVEVGHTSIVRRT